LCSLEKKTLAGVVSPSLMGSHGVVPLTIIAPLPDLCRHIANCIVRAETEVFLLTNFWVNSDASALVTNAFRELSKRAGERGTKVVVKMMYDRGSVKQVSFPSEVLVCMDDDDVTDAAAFVSKLLENHQRVPPSEYTNDKVHLPPPDEVPNLDFDLVNFHRPLLGTFHSKFAIFDRKIALLQSSNIQDNDNLEMLVRVEGPIVNSIYDTALISWEKELKPPLPMLAHPEAAESYPTFSASEATTSVAEDLPESTIKEPHYDPDLASEARRVNGLLNAKPGQSRREAATRHLSMLSSFSRR
jgi:phosphatidylserine/phosphatidylglycerophosphate/cardiolipin synthase-like enzyme